MGVDSLLAIELRNWFRIKLGLDVTVLEILSSASLAQLGQVTAKNMALKRAALAAKSPASQCDMAKEREVASINDRYLNMKAT